MAVIDELEQLLRVDLDESDPGARDVEFIRSVGQPFCDWLRHSYFRAEFEGLDNLPSPPFIAVANHSGGLLLADVWPVLSAWWERVPPEEPGYALVHDAAFRVPLLRNVLIRLGALRATTANAERALGAGGALLVFPGGDSDAQRSYWRRNVIDFHGRTGFVELALRHGVPIVPVVNVGGAEVAITVLSSPRLARITGLRRMLRVSTLPVTIGLPWGIWATGFVPYLPLPARMTFRIGEPIELPRAPALADDRALVRRTADEVVQRMQSMVDDLASRRRFPVLG